MKAIKGNSRNISRELKRLKVSELSDRILDTRNAMFFLRCLDRTVSEKWLMGKQIWEN